MTLFRGWEAKKVRAFLTCYNCHKRRCIYTKTKEDWNDACVAVQQKLESVGHRFSCGDLLFGDGPLSEVCVRMFSFINRPALSDERIRSRLLYDIVSFHAE